MRCACIFLTAGQPMLGKLRQHLLESLRGDRQVERVITLGTALIQLRQSAFETLISGIIIERTLHKTHTLLELVPHVFTERSARMRLHRLPHIGTEIVVAPLTAAIPNQPKTGRKQAPVHQIVDSRKQLLTGKITRDAEENQGRRARNTRQTPVA